MPRESGRCMVPCLAPAAARIRLSTPSSDLAHRSFQIVRICRSVSWSGNAAGATYPQALDSFQPIVKQSPQVL